MRKADRYTFLNIIAVFFVLFVILTTGYIIAIKHQKVSKTHPRTIGNSCHEIFYPFNPRVQASFDGWYWIDDDTGDIKSFCAQMYRTHTPVVVEGEKPHPAGSWAAFLITRQGEAPGVIFDTQKEAEQYVNTHEYISRH